MCSSEYGMSASGSDSGAGNGAARRTKSWNEGMFSGVTGVGGYVAIEGGVLCFCCLFGTAKCGCEILSVVFAILVDSAVGTEVRQRFR